MKIRGGSIVVKALKKLGVQTIFSLPGHQILSVFDACLDEKMNLITTRHELSAVYMSEGMSYATQEIGVALLAGGPELTNAITGLAKAYSANTPLLVICGSNTIAKRDKGFPQDMDQLELVRPFTKWSSGCYDVKRIPEYISTAYRHALRGRPGPVYLEIPYDVLEVNVDEDGVLFPEKPPLLRACGNEASLSDALRLIAQAEKPIIIAGSGVFWSRAESELKTFVERSRIPLFLTTAGMSMKLPSQLVFGIGTPAAGRFSIRAIAGADLLILLGTRINFMLGFGQAPFVSSKQKVVQVDIEPSEIGESRNIEVGIVGDVKETLNYLNSKPVETKPLDSWIHYLSKEKGSFRKEINRLMSSGHVPIHPLRLVKEIEEARDPDSTLVFDGSNSLLWAGLGIEPCSKGQTVFSPIGNLEAIGAGIPHAISLKLANPEKQVILHTGDGSFGFCAMEFETAVRYTIPFVAVVHNDCAWGMTRDMQIEYFGENRQIGNQLGIVRYDLIVKALGGHGEFVEKPEDISPALQRALSSGLPACVNVMIDPQPKSPGLMMFVLMETMLGKETFYDRIPEILRKLESWHLNDLLSSLMLKYVEAKLHRKVK